VVIWDYHVILALRTKNSADSLRGAETAANRDDDDSKIDEEDEEEIGRRSTGVRGGAADDIEAGAVGDCDGDVRKRVSSTGRRFASKDFVYDFDSRLEMPCSWEGEDVHIERDDALSSGNWTTFANIAPNPLMQNTLRSPSRSRIICQSNTEGLGFPGS